MIVGHKAERDCRGAEGRSKRPAGPPTRGAATVLDVACLLCGPSTLRARNAPHLADALFQQPADTDQFHHLDRRSHPQARAATPNRPSVREVLPVCHELGSEQMRGVGRPGDAEHQWGCGVGSALAPAAERRVGGDGRSAGVAMGQRA